MQVVNSGQRPLTKSAMTGRRQSLITDQSVSRKELSSTARDACKALNLRPALRAILSELCAVWGEQEWERILVWPSNEHLSGRTGLSERAIRYGLKHLVALGLVTPKDSANGKRYAIRAPGGAVLDAYGFDLTPLVARKGEWVDRIAEQKARAAQRKHAFDLLTCARRDVRDALTGLVTQHPEVSIHDLAETLASLETYTPKRSKTGEDPAFVLQAWLDLRSLCEERFYSAGCGGNSSPHKETDNGSPTEPCSKEHSRTAGAVRQIEHPETDLSPGTILEACPVAREFAGSQILNVADLFEVGANLRGAIGAHPSAWSEACEKVGRPRAALLVLIVAQLHDEDVARGHHKLKNPGGYFRQLVRLTAEGRYSVEAEILAMRRRKMT